MDVDDSGKLLKIDSLSLSISSSWAIIISLLNMKTSISKAIKQKLRGSTTDCYTPVQLNRLNLKTKIKLFVVFKIAN